jgi:tetratricopeptide (TPR) repeat protein
MNKKNLESKITMNWQNALQQLEDTLQWDPAIELMQNVIVRDSNNQEAYLRMLYLLMNLLVEEHCNMNKFDLYQQLAKQYFDESYKKFSADPEYLFYTGTIACISEWFFGIEAEDARLMIEKAKQIDQNNIIHKWDLFPAIFTTITPEMKAYAELVLQKNSPIYQILQPKGSLGNYYYGMMTSWSKRVLEKANELKP